MGNAQKRDSLDINLMVYVHKEDVKKIQSYINSKLKDPNANFDINMSVNQMGDTLLHYAVYKQNVELIEYLLSNKADINKKNNRSISPFELAKQCSNKSIEEKLMNYSHNSPKNEE